jgi:hypothetical protein
MGADLPESPGRIRDESANYPKTLVCAENLVRLI